MLSRHRTQFMAGLLLILAGVSLAACQRATATPATSAPPTDDQVIDPTATPSSLPTFTPTTDVAEATSAPEATATAPVSNAGIDVPYQLTGQEIIAANAGEATYSGYSCLVTTAGCACELPETRTAEFVFRQDEFMDFYFAGEGYQTKWEMLRVGPNQWEKAESIYSVEKDEAIGEVRALLSFTEDGYVFTQIVDYFEVGIVTCPDVYFRRQPEN